MKLKYLLFALFIVLILIFIGKQVFHKERIPIYIIQENAIDSLYQNTAEESAVFYKKYYIDNPYLTKLYIDSIITPFYNDLDVYELKRIYGILDKTPLSKIVAKYYGRAKEYEIREIASELNTHRELHVALLKDSLLPLLIIEADDIIEKTVNDVFEDFAGGFLNYKKIGFLFGRDAEDFTESWNEQIENFEANYSYISDKYIKEYLIYIANLRNEYFRTWLPKYNSKIVNEYKSLFQYKIPVTSEHLDYVNKYTDDEISSMISEAITDLIIDAGVITVGTLVGGPIGGFLSSTGGAFATSVGIGVMQSMEEVKNLSSDEVFVYTCTEFTIENMEKFYINQAESFNNYLLKEDQELINKIRKAL